MYIATSMEMRNIDKTTIEEFKIPGIILMETAASKVCDEISENKVLIICGTGNNGGDGFAIGRQLILKKIKVKIILVGTKENIKGDAKINYEILKNMDIEIINIGDNFNSSYLIELIKESEIIVDALFGTGLCRNIEGYRYEVIKLINGHSKKIISVDIPSGVNADTGNIMGIGVMANKTVTFELIKRGLLLYPGAEYAGKLVVSSIGIPSKVIDIMKLSTRTLNDVELKDILPKRKAYSNKGTYGKVLVIGGSINMTGAPLLAAKASYMTGAGLVNICVPDTIQRIIQQNLIEAVTTPYKIINDTIDNNSSELLSERISQSDVIVIGPGLGTDKYVLSLMNLVIETAKVPIIIDADGLNVISQNKYLLEKLKVPVILTPHLGEMSRLNQKAITVIKDNLIKEASDFSSKHNLICVLKDARTIVTSNNGDIYINITGNNGMAKAGSGDVLTGIIAGLIAQGSSTFCAAKAGVYIHGKAGDFAKEVKGERSILASDLIEHIATVFENI